MSSEKKSKGLMIVAILIVVILVGGGVAIFMMGSNPQIKEDVVVGDYIEHTTKVENADGTTTTVARYTVTEVNGDNITVKYEVTGKDPTTMPMTKTIFSALLTNFGGILPSGSEKVSNPVRFGGEECYHFISTELLGNKVELYYGVETTVVYKSITTTTILLDTVTTVTLTGTSMV